MRYDIDEVKRLAGQVIGKHTYGTLEEVGWMGSTIDDVDEAALTEAQRLLGTSSRWDTINAALREIVRLRSVRAFFDEMSARDPKELDRLRVEAWQ